MSVFFFLRILWLPQVVLQPRYSGVRLDNYISANLYFYKMINIIYDYHARHVLNDRF